jgi:nucleoporin NUP159
LTPKRILAVPQCPAIINFASNDTRLLLGLTNGQILLYDTSMLFTQGSGEINPIHLWPSAVPNALRQILPNPGDMPDQVAILHGENAPIVIEILDTQKLESVGGWSCSGMSTVPISCKPFTYSFIAI